MTGYTKLFGSIVTSTIWRESAPTKVVWITMLALADKDGIAHGSLPGLAALAGVNLKQCGAAIDKFLAPDQHSTSSEYEGRRIEKVDGGWRLLNYEKYRHQMSEEDQREKAAERQRRRRERMSQDVTPCHAPSRPVTESHACHDIAEADTEAKAEAENKEPQFSSIEAAKAVTIELRLAGDKNLVMVKQVIENEICAHPKWTPQQIAESLIETRKNYENLPQVRRRIQASSSGPPRLSSQAASGDSRKSG